MKRLITFIGVISLFVLVALYSIETFNLFKIDIRLISPEFEDTGGRILMKWRSLRYPCKYLVNSYTPTTGLISNSPKYHKIGSKLVSDSRYLTEEARIPVYYQLTAVGIFGNMHGVSNLYENPLYAYPLRVHLITRYTNDNPASLMPFLLWHTVPNAVCYELELLSNLPEVNGGAELSKSNSIFSTRQIYTNGFQVDLREFKDYRKIYWRVRALGLHHESIGEFSTAEVMYIDANAPVPDKPLVLNPVVQPLYPVYEWIPLNGIRRYEVELMTHPPVENDAQPTLDRVWSKTVEGITACYDEYARPYAGPYYWRVRAVDDDGNGIGVWSDSVKFTVEDHHGIDVAIFGDSISHGGGAVSYSPASLEYSYATYLDFPTWNLSRSGDTSTTTLERFETDVVPVAPKNLIILTGTNSLRTTMISADDVIRDIRSLRYKCEQHNIRPIFLTLMPINPVNIEYVFHVPTDPGWHEKLDKINQYIRTLPYYIDIEPYFYDPTHTVLDYSMSVDGLHPDIKGKQVIAEVINQHKGLLVFNR